MGDSRHPLYVLIVSLSLANCYFPQDSSRFPVLLPFFDAQATLARLLDPGGVRSRVAEKPSTLLALHKAMGKRKYCMLFFPNRHRKPGPKGPSAELVHAVVEMKQRNPNWGLSANRTTDRLGVPHPTRQRRGSQDSRPSLPASTGLRWSRLADFPGPHERQPLEHGSIQVRVRHVADPLGPGGHVLDGCRS